MQMKESTLALKPKADVIRSPKQGYQWPHKTEWCPTNFLKKIAVFVCVIPADM